MNVAIKKVDRRRRGRTKIDYKAIALSFDRVGHLLEMSPAGFSAKCSKGNFDLGVECLVDILAGHRNLYVTDIPVKLVWVKNADYGPFFSISSQTIGVEFVNLTDLQKLKIESFIRNLKAPENFSVSRTVRSIKGAPVSPAYSD